MGLGGREVVFVCLFCCLLVCLLVDLLGCECMCLLVSFYRQSIEFYMYKDFVGLQIIQEHKSINKVGKPNHSNINLITISGK